MTDRHLSSHNPAAGPLVSVIVVTYRHEAFIAQAVESALSQKTDFPIEILISEDCSPDRTREIVTDLQRRHPETIRLFLSERNQNDNEVITRAWKVARGRYIACLDGDDYWTDPLKLQKQVEFLDQHPDIGYEVFRELNYMLVRRLRNANRKIFSLFAWGLKNCGITQHL